MPSVTATILFGATSFFYSFFVRHTIKRYPDQDRQSSSLEEQCIPDSCDFPVTRRDNRDIECIRSVIRQELCRVSGISKVTAAGSLTSDQEESLHHFIRGVWAGARSLSHLHMQENRPHNQRAGPPVNQDHWYELNTTNVNVFPHLSNRPRCEELLPGRLFTSRLPPLDSDCTALLFRQQLQSCQVRVVVLLLTESEGEQYAGSALKALYESLQVSVVLRSLRSSAVPMPNAVELSEDVRDVTHHLASGRNVLVQCAGGNGPSGVVVASVFRNLGITDAVAWTRRVKSSYVETAAQESLVHSVPLCLAPSLCAHHSRLALAAATEHLLAALRSRCQCRSREIHTRQEESPDRDSDKDLEDEGLFAGLLQREFNAAYDILDCVHSGNVGGPAIAAALAETGVDVAVEVCLEKRRLEAEEEGGWESCLSREEFLILMERVSGSLVRHDCQHRSG